MDDSLNLPIFPRQTFSLYGIMYAIVKSVVGGYIYIYIYVQFMYTLASYLYLMQA